MGLVAVELLNLHAKLAGLSRSICMHGPVLHARVDGGAGDPNEGDAAEAVACHLSARDEAEAAADALDVEASRLRL